MSDTVRLGRLGAPPTAVMVDPPLTAPLTAP